MPLTPESKSKLSGTIRALRDKLLRDLEDEVSRVYRLSVPVGQTDLSEADRVRRGRLEAWLDERTRGAGGKAARDRFLRQAVKEAAATLLNRLVFLRLLEQTRGPDDRPLRRTRIVSGGWSSTGYLEFRGYAGALLEDGSEGYVTLLELVFDELSLDLPGLYGPVGVSDLVPVPVATLRTVIEALNLPALDGAWDDDTTLGWIYQYWNDPEREALDDKIKGGGKIEPHEIAAKTQMFTERYMVEWLLHNSLGPTWLALCRRHGWRADIEDALPGLEARRAEWRAKREAGAVALDALMPIHSPLEERWKYYVVQDIPAEAVTAAPESLRELKLLDPACGSGHFLVIACGLLLELYREEARHRGEWGGEAGTEAWSDRAIVAAILENNLHGIDIDPRAVQIAAAALWLKARTLAVGVRPRRLNLVAPAFNLSGLPDDDPALKTLLREVWRDTGLPEDLTRGIVRALAGADHLGTLLKVDQAVADAVLSHQIATGAFEREPDLFKHWGNQVESAQARPQGFGPQMNTDGHRYLSSSVSICGQKSDAPAGTEPPPDALILEKLEAFLARHTGGPDLGLRLDGEQLAAGVRFIRMVQEGTYHIVVGNPPYQGTARMTQPEYLKRFYAAGKADLYAAFMMRSLDLARDGGMFALLTMRGWMFVNQYAALRAYLFSNSAIAGIGDVDRGAFDEVPNEILAASMTIARKGLIPDTTSYAVQPTPFDDVSYDRGRTARKRAAVLVQRAVYQFQVERLRHVPGVPLIYWWPNELISDYVNNKKIMEVSPAKCGMATQDNSRFLRKPWEPSKNCVLAIRDGALKKADFRWVPYIKGGESQEWFEPLDNIVYWDFDGFTIYVWIEYYRIKSPGGFIKNQHLYFTKGVAFSPIGSIFSARAHRFLGIFGAMGASVFPKNLAEITCLMNSTKARTILQSLNPGIHFEVGDVNRLPVFPIEGADEIYARLDTAFTEHEAARENSVEFRRPGPSAWRWAQDWAQRAVDRPAGEPLPEWAPEHDPPAPVAFVSFALGVALGRFGADGTGLGLGPQMNTDEHRYSRSPGAIGESSTVDAGLILPPIVSTAAGDMNAEEDKNLCSSVFICGQTQTPQTLPHGLLLLSAGSRRDGLDHPACAGLRTAWEHHGGAIKPKADLRDWLRLDFFKHHKTLYENRPIWLPLSSAKRNFVVFAAIHRWHAGTLDELRVLLKDERKMLDGELEDVKHARAAGDAKSRSAGEKRQEELRALLAELDDFTAKVDAIADHGAPPAPGGKPRAADARFAMDLDDGVMVNAAALWPLLDPQWKDPVKWWRELCEPKGRKDYDWSHLAARYFPSRVDGKCQTDPSLAVAHRCFWTYHPARAYAWELRLQDEIGPKFRIIEPGSDDARADFLETQPDLAREIEEKEMRRRERKRAKGCEENDDEIDPVDDEADDPELV